MVSTCKLDRQKMALKCRQGQERQPRGKCIPVPVFNGNWENNKNISYNRLQVLVKYNHTAAHSVPHKTLHFEMRDCFQIVLTKYSHQVVEHIGRHQYKCDQLL